IRALVLGPSMRGLLVLSLVAACSGGGTQGAGPTSDTGVPAPSAAQTGAAQTGQDRHACQLLTHEEVSELVGEKIVLSVRTDSGETWSSCDWETAEGLALFSLTVYWSGGKEQWDAWKAAVNLGQQVFEQAEGVGPDDIIEQGPVAGIGDAAYFSTVLPSFVLKGDALLEMNLFFVEQAEAKFAGLAAKLLTRIS
ncbi:MAG TPA: DUF3558 family protein, partial [Candidatus Binatia bacterium]|nr:DUF3558 family protein [Candidatus Binatia bacterium]